MSGRRRHKAGTTIATLVLLSLALGCLATEAGTEAVRSQEAVFTVSADQLVEEYETNEVAADQVYADQVVIVSGSVTGIGKDISDTAYITIGGTGMLDGVQCFFPSSGESEIAALIKGDEVTVKGRVSRKTMNVIVKDCVLQSD